jgi:5-formyltetrahydrofolate cyclo-ligase
MMPTGTTWQAKQRAAIAGPEEDPNVVITCASPPCFAHELDPAYFGVPTWAEVRLWRQRQRVALIEQRLAVPSAERATRDGALTRLIHDALPDLAGKRVGVYWPFKGEYDPRPLMRALHAEGVRLALPVVVKKASPLLFRAWHPGERLVPGVWNIPVPATGDAVTPDVLLIPLVGFDAGGYRLGYGGGYYDRTLAALSPRPLAIGLGFAFSQLPSIHPQPHDVPMNLIITEGAVLQHGEVGAPASHRANTAEAP